MAAVLGLSPPFASGARSCGWFSATRSKASSLLFHEGRHTSTSRSFYFANLSNKPMSVKSSKMFPKTRGTIDSQTSESAEVDEKDPSELTKTPFGYTRKDVLLIGLGVTVVGVALKNGLEQFVGLDSLQAGNVVQLVIVLGLTIGWISTYVFRVSNKEMTYAQQLRDYENKVMQKRLEGLTEAELEELLAQVEEEKRQQQQQLSGTEQIK